ncbi:MAG: di-trans,poly-cis-decaprenylcistransferase, partial [Alphaproteobacteria bacterium]
ATARGLPRSAGHEAGVKTIQPILEAAPTHGIGMLTLYAFSSDNWKRPQAEVNALMNLLRCYLDRETARFAEKGVRLTAIGRRDRLPNGLSGALARAEAATAGGTKLHLRVAIDYSARDAILRAAAQASTPEDLTREGFARLITGGDASRDVDLLIRTGGEQRLSDFLLWECAYAELYFTPRMWPDFSANDLAEAVDSFHKRERRFGKATASAPAAA